MTQADNNPNYSYDFKYTIPIEKSLRGEKWIIRGVAAGTEIDQQGDVLTPEAIQRLAAQINENPVPFRNQHQVDDIMEDLGLVVKAFVSPDYNLEVEVELDQDNPSAQYLWKKLDRGKQYGMSIRGSTVRPYSELEKSTGRIVRYHPFVTIEEVSATTRPVYSHSLGTVLKKAIDLAEASNASGDNVMNDTPTTGESQVASETSAPENVSAPETKPSEELVKSLMANDEFKTFMADTLRTIVAESQAETQEDTTEISKSEKADEDTGESESLNVEELVKSIVTELNASTDAKIEALASRIAERGPAVLVKSDEETADEIIKSLREDPRQALRVGLAASHGELDKYRQ